MAKNKRLFRGDKYTNLRAPLQRAPPGLGPSPSKPTIPTEPLRQTPFNYTSRPTPAPAQGPQGTHTQLSLCACAPLAAQRPARHTSKLQPTLSSARARSALTAATDAGRAAPYPPQKAPRPARAQSILTGFPTSHRGSGPVRPPPPPLPTPGPCAPRIPPTAPGRAPPNLPL